MKIPDAKQLLFGVALWLGVVGCGQSGPKIPATVNQSAGLVGRLPENPLEWEVITSAVDKKKSTMSTLYGNNTAVQYARTNTGSEYPAGSTIALVTWSQRADDRYFGARIPEAAISVEFVFFAQTPAAGQPRYSYERYEGTPLQRTSKQQSESSSRERTEYLIAQRAAVLP
jgi:hypothetical protein